MTSRCTRLAIAVLAGFLIFLTNCRHVDANPPANQYVSLSKSGGTCQQNGSSGVIELFQNQPVVYQGATALNQFQAQFTTCPFASCPVNSPGGSAVNVGKPTADSVNKTFMYSSLTIDNAPCNNVQPMGVRIKPGP